MVIVAEIGPPRGIAGEMLVLLRTDQPERRFASGAELQLADGRSVTVKFLKRVGKRMSLALEEVNDRNTAETLRGELLLAPVDTGGGGDNNEPEGYYPEELIGLRVDNPSGSYLGKVSDVCIGAAQDLIIVERAGDSSEVMVPFVSELVPEVDTDSGRIVVVDLDGLF